MVDRSSVCFVEHHKKLYTMKRMVISRKNKNKPPINEKLIKISKTRVIKAYPTSCSESLSLTYTTKLCT